MNDHEIFSKSEIESIMMGEWKSEFEEIIYVFSNSPSFLKKGSFDLLISNTKSGNYFLTTYSILTENENTLIEMGKEKLFVKYFLNDIVDKIIHLEKSNHNLLILKKL
jgi:hypothetical protein